MSAVYEEGVDNDEEDETLKVQRKSETNKKDGYKGQTPLKLSELIQPRETISDENSSTHVVSEGDAEEFQEQPSVFDETAPATGSSQHLENSPFDIFLIPVANVSMVGSGIDEEFSEDVRDTKKSSEQLNLQTIPFLTRSQSDNLTVQVIRRDQGIST
jgi:hypothetical protein